MEEKLNFATLIFEQAVPATGKGAAELKDELGQDSAELSWIQLPPQEGRGGRDRGTGELPHLGPSLPSSAILPASSCPRLLAQAKQTVRPQTFCCTLPPLSPHHFAILLYTN